MIEDTAIVSEPLLNPQDDPAGTTASTLAAIGLRIREVRLARNMTLQALADACGLSASMLSLVERGRASPSIGSLIVIANALGVQMSDFIVDQAMDDEKLVVSSSEQRVIETAAHVIRRLIKEDRARGVSIALNEYAPHTGATEKPITHDGFEYGFVLEGKLTVEVDGTLHVVESGDLISYSSRRPHRIWNHGKEQVRTLWINLQRD
ncbi:XRE family transcriptional regulator [Hyphomicrobiales bacterium]|jgi:transcriptional regulator with XRE-family HTH domain|uniref:cupin domain-containing protein n=1 Tax=Chelatococcus sp. TaxID=1953771 RepID=UPI00224BD55D|nr:cupin domain-containing protein [Chelatococcus sp.]MBX3538301.1 cupin domain-containing protein [Chelatococcus sp.]CAH1694548.1 XRE family transcriptional regulator [Hyphomicrobiales bacterium]CAH1695177.1 XRE family transcriptional regulator [Hyphomicrobiales bacterium]